MQNDKKFVAHKTEMGIHQTMEKNKATATDNESVVRWQNDRTRKIKKRTDVS